MTTCVCLLPGFWDRIMDKMSAGPCGWTSEHGDQDLLAEMGRDARAGVRRSALGSCMHLWRMDWVSQGNWELHELQFVRLRSLLCLCGRGEV